MILAIDPHLLYGQFVFLSVRDCFRAKISITCRDYDGMRFCNIINCVRDFNVTNSIPILIHFLNPEARKCITIWLEVMRELDINGFPGIRSAPVVNFINDKIFFISIVDRRILFHHTSIYRVIDKPIPVNEYFKINFILRSLRRIVRDSI